MSDYPKMKVLFAVNDFTMGGAQRLYVDLFDELDRSSFELHLLTLRQFPQRQDLYHLVNAEVVVHRLNFLSFRSLGQWVKLLLLLRRIRPDVVVSSLFFTNTIVRVLKPLLGYRVLSMEHNTYIHKTRAQILVDRILAKLTEKIIAVSTTVGEFTIEQQRLQPSKVQVIHNGVNVRAMSAYAKERSPATVRELLGFKPDDKIIINVGRLTEQKNHKLLIQGFASFSAKHPGYLLCLLGEGNLREDLVARARAAGVASQVLMLGAKKNIYDYYMVADWFASTSIIEGLSISFLEAMAFGVPLLSTRTAGTDELVRDNENGFFIPSYEVADVVAGLERMAGADRAKLGQGALATAEQYSIQRAAASYSQLILGGIQAAKGRA
jgi:glycosyltransferase involved in cell wall biosynthesis